jgi:serine/threonine protein kinase
VIEDAEKLAKVVCAAGLLDRKRARELAGTLAKRFANAKELADELVQRGWLTSYQSCNALNGQASELVLGSYVLLEPLGAGGMGQVFKARHQLMNRLVAIKVIRPELLANVTVVQRFRREARLAACLNHPNVVLAHDAQEVSGRLFLVMEYIEGTTLAELIRRNGSLSPNLVADYGRQVALGLEHAHSQGLIHRDIKPENLLIAGGVVKVADLGVARPDVDGSLDLAVTEAGRVLGTVDFLAPEQATDARTVDARSDLYSLGCTLYFALTGQVPFPGGALTEKLLRHRLEAPQPLDQIRPEVPAGLCEIVTRLMAKEPSHRYPSAEAVAAALVPWCCSFVPNSSSVELAHSNGVTDVSGPSIPSFFAAETGSNRETALSDAAKVPSERRRFTRRRSLVIAGLAGIGLTTAGFVLMPRRSWKPGPVFEPIPDELAPNEICSVAVSPNERYVAFACGNHTNPHTPGAIGLVDLHTGKSIRLGVHTKAVRRVAFTPNGAMLISATGTDHPKQALIGEVRFWDVQKGRELSDRSIPRASNKGILDLALDPGGKWLALAGRDPVVRLRDVETGKIEHQFKPQFLTFHTAVALSPDGSLLAAADGDGRLWVWRVADQTVVYDVPVTFQARAFIAGLAFRSDSHLVGVAGVPPGGEAVIKVWNLSDRKLEYAFRHGTNQVFGMALAADGRTLVTACQYGMVRLWDVENREPLEELKGHTDTVRSVAFSSNGRLLASAGSDRTIRVWLSANA